MNYTFNKTLIEQVKAGTHCIEFNREKDSLEMLQALLDTAFPDDINKATGKHKYYGNYAERNDWWDCRNETDKTPIPLSNFVQPEQSERDVMAELDERLKRLEDIFLLNKECDEDNWEYARCVKSYWCFTEGIIYPITPFANTNPEPMVTSLDGKSRCNLVNYRMYFMPATFEEYNAQQNQPEPVNPVRWRAENGVKYYAVLIINGQFRAAEDIEQYTQWDNSYYNCGNYFQTTQQAEEMAVLMQFTLNNPELVKQLMDNKE